MKTTKRYVVGTTKCAWKVKWYSISKELIEFRVSTFYSELSEGIPYSHSIFTTSSREHSLICTHHHQSFLYLMTIENLLTQSLRPTFVHLSISDVIYFVSENGEFPFKHIFAINLILFQTLSVALSPRFPLIRSRFHATFLRKIDKKKMRESWKVRRSNVVHLSFFITLFHSNQFDLPKFSDYSIPLQTTYIP